MTHRIALVLAAVLTTGALAGCGRGSETPLPGALPGTPATVAALATPATPQGDSPDLPGTGVPAASDSPAQSATPAEGSTIPPVELTLAPLEETVRRLFADSLGFVLADPGSGAPGIHSFALLKANTPAEIPTTWLVHTVGLRDFATNQAHRINIYQQIGDQVVAEVARINLDESTLGADAAGMPDFLGEGSVHQAEVAPPYLWFAVEGGVGAHGGAYTLLRLDPGENVLTVALVANSESPGVATERDLNGDGQDEILVDATDHYVFCYACGVTLPQTRLWRWDGSAIAPVLLTPLDSDASQAAQTANNALLALADAGLWKDVYERLPPAEALQAGNPAADASGVLAWNLRLLRLDAEARRAASLDPSAPFPLLSHTFYGDYDAAAAILQAMPVEALFATPSALISGTVAAGWEATLANWISRSTTPTLAHDPQLAPAWFVRGWGEWLIGDFEDARASLTQAVALAPENGYFAAAAAFLDASSQESGARLVALTPVEVRSGPGNTFSIIGTLQPGESITVTGRFVEGADAWWQVPAPGDAARVGWVHDDRARISAANVAHVPEVVAAAQVAPVAQQGRLLFSREVNGVAAVYEVGVGAASEAALVVDQARQPALQPNSSVVAFSSQRPDMLGLGGIDLRTGQRVRYTYNVEDALPRWNALGDQMIFSSTREGDRRARIYHVYASGSVTAEVVQLGQDADWNQIDNRILFKGCDETGNRCGLWIVNEDGSGATAVTEVAADARPRWSPDGSAALFMSDGRDGNWEVYMLRFADGRVTRLTDDNGEDGLPAFSPDGSSFAWVARRDGVWGVYTQLLDGGSPLLVHAVGSDYPNWLDQGVDWAP